MFQTHLKPINEIHIIDCVDYIQVCTIYDKINIADLRIYGMFEYRMKSEGDI